MTKTVDVAANQKIASTWGNEIRDRTFQVFASAAERDAQWPTAPNGAQCVTMDTGLRWRRINGGWGRLTVQSGIAAGPGGNYAAGAPFISLPFATDPGPRVLSFTYNSLVTAQGGASLDIGFSLSGAGFMTYRHPGNGNTVQVNATCHGVVIGAAQAAALQVSPSGSTITLYNDPLLHILSWRLDPL